MIYNDDKYNEKTIAQYLHFLHKDIEFADEMETNSNINFLDFPQKQNFKTNNIEIGI